MKKSILFLIILVGFVCSQTLWEQVNPKPTGNDLYSVQMLDTTTIWAFGQAGMMVCSEDFGKNWQACLYEGIVDDIFDSHFFDSKSGIIVGENGSIYQTKDQCKTWQKISCPVNRTLKDIDFSGTLAVAVGDSGTVITSYDKGITWKVSDFPINFNLNSVSIILKEKWVVVGENGLVAQTTNSGNSWSVKYQKEKLPLYSVNEKKWWLHLPRL